MAILPYWITPPELGSFPQSYNFGLIENNLILSFYSETSASVSLLNGNLLEGLSYYTTSNSVVITGEVSSITSTTTMFVTFRVTDSNDQIADRTFYLTSVLPAEPASWNGQDPNLGYISAGNTSTVSVHATTTGTIPIVYGLVNPPTNMSINSSTGEITFQPPALSPNTTETFTFTVNASVSTSVSNLVCNIVSVSVPSVPVWVTPAGQIGTISQGKTLEIQLSAFDSQNQQITYSLHSGNLPFNLSQYGLIWGVAPAATFEDFYTFTVTATSPSGSTNNTFTIEVTQYESSNVVFVNQSGELGHQLIDPLTGSNVVAIQDGQYVSFDLSAVVSTVSNIVIHTESTYGLVGGSYPPVLTLNHATGELYGFIDYSPIAKDYWFDIQAFNGTTSTIQKFHVLVIPSTQGMFFDVSVPLHGRAKSLLDNAVYSAFGGINANAIIYSPAINVINGIELNVNNVDTVFDNVSSLLAPAQLRLGNVQISNTNVTTASSNNKVYYSTVVDPQSGAYDQINYSYPQPSTILSGSINSWRDAFTNNFAYVGQGSGTGAVLSASVSIVTGEILTVDVVEPGSGFLSSPIIDVSSPTGNGAILSSRLSVISASVISSNNLWVVGNVITLSGVGTSAQITIDSLTPSGNVSTISITNSGSYTLFPAGVQSVNNGNAVIDLSVSLGISNVDIVAAGKGYAYGNTSVTVGGSEILPNWQSTYAPVLPIALIDANTKVSSSNLLIANSANGTVFNTNQLVITAKGREWRGTTAFDVTFDSETTRFPEYTDPHDVIFDNNMTTFDENCTEFDGDDIDWRPYGTTIFDGETTIFDLESTIFDQVVVPTSVTEAKHLVRMRTPRYRGNSRINSF